MENKFQYTFPKDFLWGAATAAHQTEGNNLNDWTIWEQQKAEVFAKNAKSYFKRLNLLGIKLNWEKFGKLASSSSNYISGQTSNSYQFYNDDINLLKVLGIKSFRFSIEWSRIEPEEGRFIDSEIERYKNILKTLKDSGIKPLVTLWHFSSPIWFAQKGGWTKKSNIKYFTNFVSKIVSELKDVDFWVTINEPMVYSSKAYFEGRYPPGKHNLFLYLRAINNFITAHKESYKIIKNINTKAQVSIAKHNIVYMPYKGFFYNKIICKFLNWFWNKRFLQKIKNHMDYIGINHYSKVFVDWVRNRPLANKFTDMGWAYHPESIYEVLKDLKRFKLPIYITENGIADDDDDLRENYIKDYLLALYKAIKEGIDVKGYFYWSLIDNFEWDLGFWPRFGLIEVDYKTSKRKIRKSALAYSKIIKNNAL